MSSEAGQMIERLNSMADANGVPMSCAGLMEEAANLIEELANFIDFISDELDYGKGEYVGLSDRWTEGDVPEQYLSHSKPGSR